MSRNVDAWKKTLDTLEYMTREGHLSAEKLEMMMDKLIDTELEKPGTDVDVAFIVAAEEMLSRVNAKKAQDMKSNKCKNLRAIKKRIREKEGKASRVPFPLKVICVTACVLAVTFAVSLLLPIKQINTYITPDEQQYVVRGEKMSNELIAQAMAECNSDDLLHLQTSSFNEVCDFLGFVPDVPQYVPDGWNLSEYSIYLSVDNYFFAVFFENSDHAHLLSYNAVASDDVELIGSEYEQNEIGVVIKLSNGMSAYMSHNTDDLRIDWHDGFVLFNVYGPVTEDEAMKIINSIS